MMDVAECHLLCCMPLLFSLLFSETADIIYQSLLFTRFYNYQKKITKLKRNKKTFAS